MTTTNAALPNRMTIRWTEDPSPEGEMRWKAEVGNRMLTVFASPFKQGKFCWRKVATEAEAIRKGSWKVYDGGICDNVEAAMDAAATSLLPKNKRSAFLTSTRSRAYSR